MKGLLTIKYLVRFLANTPTCSYTRVFRRKTIDNVINLFKHCGVHLYFVFTCKSLLGGDPLNLNDKVTLLYFILLFKYM